VLGREDDGTLHVEIRLAANAVLAPGDRFIARRPAPVDTVGGGIVVDARPPRVRHAPRADFAAAALEPASSAAIRLARAGPAGVEPVPLAAELGLARRELEAALDRLVAAGRAVRAGSRWLDSQGWDAAGRDLVRAVADFHARQPLEEGVAREALRGRVSPTMPQDAWRQLLEQHVRQGALRLRGELVARAGHAVVLEGDARDLAERIEESFREAGLEPPDLGAIVTPGEMGRARPIVEQLVARGRLSRIQDGRLFHAAALAGLRERLREYGRASRTIDVAEFKRLAGVTRKNAIPLLEQLDAERTTRRVGNVREILPRSDGATE
jgi:selenocysteine-specific elongation factor